MTINLTSQWKKITATVATALFIYLNKKIGLGMDEDTISQIVSVAIAYIVGQGLADFGKNAAPVIPVIIQETAPADVQKVKNSDS